MKIFLCRLPRFLALKWIMTRWRTSSGPIRRLSSGWKELRVKLRRKVSFTRIVIVIVWIGTQWWQVWGIWINIQRMLLFEATRIFQQLFLFILVSTLCRNWSGLWWRAIEDWKGKERHGSSTKTQLILHLFLTNKRSIRTIYERKSLPMISNPQDHLKVPEKPVTPVSSPEVMSETRDDLLQV